MKKRERVLVAVKHEPVDRIPCYSTIRSAKEAVFGQAAVEEHPKLFWKVDPDIRKTMNEHLIPSMGPIRAAEDWKCIRTIIPKDKFMKDEVELVEGILNRCDRDAPDISILYGIAASTVHPIEPGYDYMPVRQLLCSHLRQNRGPVLGAMKWTANGLRQLAGKFVGLGLDDTLHASLGSERFLSTDQEFEEYTMPFGKQIMKARLETGGHNTPHMCKIDTNSDRYDSYKGFYSTANWGIYETGVSLAEGRKRFADCAIMGDLSNHKGLLIGGTPDEIRQEVRRIIVEAGETGLILGIDCTIPMGMPYKHTRIAAEAIKWGPDRGKSMKTFAGS